MNTVIVLAMHGAPPLDLPEPEAAELFALHARLERAAGPGRVSLERRYAELDARVRAWPRTADNDPFYAGSARFLAAQVQRSGPGTRSDKPAATIYTDGACVGNPGPGGYAAIVRDDRGRQELSGGFRLTTNNRMEIMAAIAGLRALGQPSSVMLYSDSQYLVDSVTKGWVLRWRANRWRTSGKTPALNRDLWEQLLDLLQQHEVRFEWVRGHAGDTDNERCDELAMRAAQRPDLPADTGYEASQPDSPARTLFD